MLAEKRRQVILDAVTARGSMSNTELSRQCKVSVETIRRDVILLDDQGILRRTHGGALSINSIEPDFAHRMSANLEGKRAIGRLAASLVPDKVSVIIDAGTTAFCVAEALANHSGLTVVTAGLQAANFLAGRNGNEVILTGGHFLAPPPVRPTATHGCRRGRLIRLTGSAFMNKIMRRLSLPSLH